jgi:CMP-N-acetylneuraminic acid synthetase
MQYKPKSLFSVVKSHKNPYFNMVEEDSEGKAIICKSLTNTIGCRQNAPQVYDMNASIYFYDRNFILDEKTTHPISDNSRIYVMEEKSSYDIDREIDFKFIEFLVKEKLVEL